MITNKFKAFTEATRPKTLSASLGPVIVGLALSSSHAVNGSLIALLIIICALFLQIGANLSNDYFDSINKIDRKDRIGPDRASATGNLMPSEIKIGYRVSFITSFLIGIYLIYIGGIPIFLIGLSSIIFAYFYTGGPFPLSYVGFGEILAFIFFGPVAVWGTWFLMTEKMEILPALVGFGAGFIAWSIMAINNMRDRKSDKLSGKITLAVVLGEKMARFIVIFGIIGSVLIPVYLAYRLNNKYLLLSGVSFLIFLKTWQRILFNPINKEQNISLSATSAYLLLYCLLMSLGFLISSY
jgi:1,4-dihydroxy-2-naphthoate polyprenyltransferase